MDTLYNLRLEVGKNSILGLITKLIMNSLHGKFGASSSYTTVKVINKNEFLKFDSTQLENLVDVIPYPNSETKLVIHTIEGTNDEIFDNDFSNTNSSLPISIAIAAGGRIIMSRFKNQKDITLYYTDTDSIYIGAPYLNI